ncbi:MAG: uncharacterized protein JWO60_1619 [Frankiales bacterium]|nr:uncharacterized protein [Frankiales bacterium]
MPRLLVVHHTPSPALQELLEAVREGAALVPEVDVVVRPALTCSPVEVLECDGLVLGTPANLGYMSGALKHFFDTAYYPCLDATVGRPFGLYVHGGDDVGGAVRSVEKVTGALRWKRVAPVLEVRGGVQRRDREGAVDLGGTVAAVLS